jgi:hypothetical protein
MNKTLATINHKSKSLLCIALMLTIPWIATGCGQGGAFLPGNTTTTPVTSAEGLAQKLDGTPFAGARQIEVDSTTQNFRVTSGDGSSTLSGSYAINAAGQTYVSTFVMTSGGRTVTLKLNENREITDLTTSAGTWNRPVSLSAPQAPQAPKAPGARTANTVDAYLTANAGLFALAQQADAQLAADAVKTADASFWPAFAVLAYAVIIPLGIGATLLFAVEVIVLLNAIL